ncbi:MAG: DNA primase [Gallionellaceae bacterium]
MNADLLLSHLEKVKRTGQGRWLACCPAHQDRTASLSIRELDDGRILLHDFGGCSTEEVLGAVGLTFDALFPEKPIEHGKPERRPFPAADILRGLAAESKFVYLAARAVSAGEKLGDTDLERLLVAVGRIESALQAGGLL